MAKDILITPLDGDIVFNNTAGTGSGAITQDGDNLVISNAVGDVLLGDGDADVYIGDGTNNVDIVFEQSGTIKAEDGSSGVTLTLGSSDTTLVLGGPLSLADSVSDMSGTGVNTVDIGTSAKPFKNIYAAHHVGGSSINYATSRGWVEDAAPAANQIGEFGGNFILNGVAAENAIVWGLDPFGNKALLWKSILNTSDDNADGGWNKEIVIPANNNIGYLSYVYFKVDFTADSAIDGQFYLGSGQVAGETLNLDGSNNTNAYFKSGAINVINNGGPATANRWYVIVGILQAYNNSTTDNDTVAGVYDVETGEKVAVGGEFKMGNNTTGQKHRTYIYYDQSTDANENAYFWNPGFHAIDGSEPKIQDLVKRQVYLDDNVKAAFGTGNDLEIYHDGSNSYIDDSGVGSLYIRGGGDVNIRKYTGEQMIKAIQDGAVELYHNNVKKIETSLAGIEVTGNITSSGALFTGDIKIDNPSTVGQLYIDSAATSDVVINLSNNDVQKSKIGWDHSESALAFVVGTGAFSTADMVVSSSGNVGIGTTTPAYPLDVNGEGKVTGKFRVGGAVMLAEPGTGVLLFGSEGGNSTAIYAASTERIRIDSSGNVGIGTTSPSEKLQVEGNISASGNLSIGNGGDGVSRLMVVDSDSQVTLEKSAGSYFTSFGFDSNQNYLTYYSSPGMLIGYGSTTGAAPSVNTLFLKADGKVGIGTTSPTEALTVTGDISASGDININNNSQFKGKHTNGSEYGLLTLTSGNQIKVGAYDYTSASTEFGGGDNAKFLIGSTEVMRLRSTGLEVTGAITASGNISSSGTIIGAGIDLPYENNWSYIRNNTVNGGLRFGTQNGAGVLSNQIELSAGGNYVKLNNPVTVSGALTVGVDDTGHDVKFFGATAGKYMAWDQANDGLVIQTNPGSLGLGVFTAGSSTTPNFKVGRYVTEYWGVSVEDRTAHLIHRQDETDSGAMNTSFELWGGGSGNDYWTWKHGTNTGGSLATVMTLDKAGLLTVTGDISASGTGSFSDGRFTGKVGIGTATPDELFDVAGTARFETGIAEGTIYVGNNIQHWGDGGTGVYFDTDEVQIQTDGGTERLKISNTSISASSNVYITGSTINPLHVRNNDAAGDNGYSLIKVENGFGNAEFGTVSSYARIRAAGNEIFAGNYGATYFYNNGKTSLTMNSNGVGIGTASPSAKLHIAGNVWASGSTATGAGHITASGNISSSGNIIGSNLIANSASFSTRVTLNDAKVTNSDQDLSTYALIANISGSFFAPSASFSTRVTLNDAKVTNSDQSTADINALDITEVGTISSGVWQGTTIKTAYIGNDQVTEDKLANTLLAEIDANTAKTTALNVATGSLFAASASFSTRVTLNDAKVTNVSTNLTATTHASQITINSSDGDNVVIAEASDTIAGLMTTTHHDKLDGIEASATADQTQADINGLAITTVGTIGTGVWNGTVIASAKLDTDTAHLSGAQSFTGLKTFTAGIAPSYIKHTISGNNAGDYGPGAEILFGIVGSGAAVVAGSIYTLRSGVWTLIDANTDNRVDRLCAVAVGTNSSTSGMLIRGCVTLASVFTAGTDIEGVQVYASETTGQATITAPSDSTDLVRILGYSLNVSAKKMFFNPDSTFLEIA